MFHHLIVDSMESLLVFFKDEHMFLLEHKNPLTDFLYCDFNGEESFQEVVRLLDNNICSILDYVFFILQIPHIKSFYKIKEVVCNNSILMIALYMPMVAFKDFSKANSSHVIILQQLNQQESTATTSIMDIDEKVDLSSKQCQISNDNPVGKKRKISTTACQRKKTTKKLCTTAYNYKLGGTSKEDNIDPTDIQQMYYNCLELASQGNFGIGKQPPTATITKRTSNRYNYINCNFMDSASGKNFVQSVSREEAIQVSDIM
jgi:hypothetical protein